MIRFAILAMALLASTVSLVTSAQQSNDIYRIEIPVPNQSEAERTAAARATLGDVIVRVTGDAAALQHPMVRQAISEAPDYLAKFNYTTDTTSAAPAAINLILNYSPKAITHLLQQAQLIAAPAMGQQSITFNVTNVPDLAAFKQVQSYLKTVGIIRNIELLGANKDTLSFTAMLDGDVAALTTIFSASNKLRVNGEHLPATTLSLVWQNE